MVDDETSFLAPVSEHLQSQGFDTLTASSGAAALELAQAQHIDVVVTDLRMPGMDGLELLTALKQVDPLVQVVVLTGQAAIESAVEAMRRGAYDYVAKPIRLGDIEAVVRRAMENAVLSRQNRAYREMQRQHRVRIATDIVASSQAMRQILQQAEGFAKTDLPVLIDGETGTGKEVIAEFIHANGERRDLPLTVLDCGSLAENLVDSELFGHEKGAFTGAVDARPGMLEVADGGTLLLDEIGELPLAVQARLLRFLENGTFRRVGGRVEKAVDVRVLAATNRQLDQDVTTGRFREDLYHRLVVFRLTVPPLRERTEDIQPLAETFRDRVCGTRHTVLPFAASAQAALKAHSWPGNVRELLHTVERACFAARLTGATEINLPHLGLPGAHPGAGVDPAMLSLREAEKRHVDIVLKRCDGNRKRAAEVLGVSERQLYRLIQSTDGAQATSA